MHTMLTSDNEWLRGDEAHAAWFPPGHEKHGPLDWGEDFLKGMEPGGSRAEDVAEVYEPRRAHTADFASTNTRRPNVPRWYGPQ